MGNDRLVELQKALDEVEAVVWATCEWGSLGREKMNVLMNLFSAFQKDCAIIAKDQYEHFKKTCVVRDRKEYESEVHVSRKQLSELPRTFTICGDCRQKVKELLSGSVEAPKK